MSRLLPVLLVPVFALPAPAGAAELDDRLQRGILRCEEFSPREFETGLAFNPDGYRTYYRRSACLQRLAIEYRELQLCERVRRRFSLFSSGWGYSPDNCRNLVETELQQDRAELQALRQSYLAGPVRLVEVQWVRNGNGRDYDLIPRFEDGYAHGYRLEFSLVDRSGIVHPVHEHGAYLRGSNDRLRLYLPRADLRARYPGFDPGGDYRLQTRLILDPGQGGVGGWLRQETIDQVFPESERSQLLETTVTF